VNPCAAPGGMGTYPCQGTPGFWMNHCAREAGHGPTGAAALAAGWAALKLFAGADGRRK